MNFKINFYLYSLGIAWAAVFLTKGHMSVTPSLMAINIIGTIIDTLILESTLNALARIIWFESLKYFKFVFLLLLQFDKPNLTYKRFIKTKMATL